MALGDAKKVLRKLRLELGGADIEFVPEVLPQRLGIDADDEGDAVVGYGPAC
jgi:hypothetical protein